MRDALILEEPAEPREEGGQQIHKRALNSVLSGLESLRTYFQSKRAVVEAERQRVWPKASRGTNIESLEMKGLGVGRVLEERLPFFISSLLGAALDVSETAPT